MHRTNLFDGDSLFAIFVRIAYERLMSRNWVTYADIIAHAKKKQSVNDLENCVSNYDEYGELKKAFPCVCKAIKDKVGIGSIVVEGNNRNRRFRYIGRNTDPLADMKNAKVINNLRQYWKFCQDSAGFFPQSWLDYYFQDCVDLLQIKDKKEKGEQVICASIDRIHKNIEFLPFLYEAIINKRVLEIDYKPFEEEQETILIHPHYLKEYNGRWHLFGHVDGRNPENGYDVALDRIQSRPREKEKMEYIAAPPMYYKNHFDNMVGVSHLDNPIIDDIIVRAHSYYIYNLMVTKPLHNKQGIKKKFGDYEDGTYGELIVHVEVNNEFIGRILQMGSGLEIMEPKEARDLFSKRVQELADLYKEKKK